MSTENEIDKQEILAEERNEAKKDLEEKTEARMREADLNAFYKVVQARVQQKTEPFSYTRKKRTTQVPPARYQRKTYTVRVGTVDSSQLRVDVKKKKDSVVVTFRSVRTTDGKYVGKRFPFDFVAEVVFRAPEDNKAEFETDFKDRRVSEAEILQFLGVTTSKEDEEKIVTL